MLDVKGNVGMIDEAVSALENVSHLYIQVYQNYKVFGAGFRQLTNLRVFDLSSVGYLLGDYRYKLHSYCHLATAQSNLFGNITTEKDLELHLSNCYMTEKDIFIFPKSLVTLDLSHNQNLMETDSTSWMKGMINTRINHLDLSWTFPNLEYNYISDGYFTYLAKTNVKIIVLKQNLIGDILARHLIFSKTIEKLDISNNNFRLKDLHSTFVHYSDQDDFKLKELYVNYQQDILKTPRQISHRTTDANIVGNFNASNTRYKSTGEAGRLSSPSNLPNGVILNGSQILNTSITMRKAVNSRHAAVANAGPLKVFNKETFDCEENLEEQDPDIQMIYLPSDLEAIYANSAILSYAFKSVPHIRIVNNTVLRHVELAENPLTSLLGPVENVPSLQLLNISRNHLKNLSVHFFKCMVSLQTLILKENSLDSSLAADVNGLTFSTLTKLMLLDLSYNSIKDLSRLAFINNRNLQILNLSNNQLIQLQPTISTILNMSFLDLSDNRLPGLSEQTSNELKRLKSRNKQFTVNVLGNRLLFTCDYLPFLHLVLLDPHIFFRVDHLQFTANNGTTFFYKELADYFPLLAIECLAQRFFYVILTIFFVIVGTVTICAIIYYKRWKLRYLYYTSRRRMHIAEHVVDYSPDADVFLTYDQDDLHWRRFMQQTFLPGLNQRNITYILGEVDFPGGDVMAHVTGAVVGTRKTVVLLSADIFDDHHREYEMNLSIMREMETRSLKIVPIFVEDVDLHYIPEKLRYFYETNGRDVLGIVTVMNSGAASLMPLERTNKEVLCKPNLNISAGKQTNINFPTNGLLCK